MEAEEFFQLKNGGKSSKLALEHGELISPVWAVELMQQYADEVSLGKDEQIRKLKFMVKNGLGPEDMINDIT